MKASNQSANNGEVSLRRTSGKTCHTSERVIEFLSLLMLCSQNKYSEIARVQLRFLLGAKKLASIT